MIKIENTATRIQKRMEQLGLKQTDLVERTGISKGALSSYLSGRYVPKQTNTYLIAEALNVDEAWLMGADVPMERKNKTSSKEKGIEINVLGSVAAGIPIEAIEDIIDTEEISEKLAKTGKFFGLRIKGDSMSPDICNGDVVIVRQQDDAESGDIVIAMVNGDEATCKRLRKYKDGIELIPKNPSYDTLEFSKTEIIKKPVHIIGKVVESRRKF